MGMANSHSENQLAGQAGKGQGGWPAPGGTISGRAAEPTPG